MTDEELVRRLRALGRDFDDWDTAGDRIEALTAKLAKAMDGLRNIAVVGFSSDPSVNAAIAKQTVTQARAIIAEIEGEK